MGDSTIMPGNKFVFVNTENETEAPAETNPEEETAPSETTPTEEPEGEKHAGSMIGNGSVAVVISMAALVVSVAALGVAISNKKRASQAEDKE